ncbi:host attachment protein [Gluconacetobacter azotocaptans]|uniref:Host attachment protein n=1 Tax=Gluconacetobacter azotocaptans TaxID=142834 RepID=A0A7W4PCP2_9PROT|nr:host attachment protein [Gluconacetobacter azotocaptans]MBB2188908.1 host attachment protein [Gluconacetobacter azotocaptans]MBM9401520.1 host attachment protein [Gluconacetobacter azotocaptans]GBQ26039.1 hypothetical protein AA13594_0114 [Gluconacetobacter azotocaptans DSM 13594]
MLRKQNILFVIADGEHARFVQADHNRALHSIASFDSAAAHKQSSDLGDDAPGASFHSDAIAHHALAPRHDLHTLEKQKFARLVAAQINARQTMDDALVVVAPARTSAIITQNLAPAVGCRVIGVLDKDLVKVPDHELKEHVGRWMW